MPLSRDVPKEDEHSTTWMNSLSAGMQAKRVFLEMHMFKA